MPYCKNWHYGLGIISNINPMRVASVLASIIPNQGDT